MDDLDREIEEAAGAARRRVRQGRVATIASVGAFFLVAIVGLIAVYRVFPEPDVSEYDARRNALKAQSAEPTAATLAGDYSAYRRDQSRARWKVMPVFALAFASAYFVSKRLKPQAS
jgi:hypothetical protein